jgi:hypothetical protein
MTAFSRRRMRLRTVALPVRFVTVKPKRAVEGASPVSPRARASSTKPCVVQRDPPRTRRNSARRFSVTSLIGRFGRTPAGNLSGRGSGAWPALRQTDVCGPSRVSAPEPSPRRGSAYVCGSHGAVCGRAGSADRCASRSHSDMGRFSREARKRPACVPARHRFRQQAPAISRSIWNPALIGGAGLQVNSTGRGNWLFAPWLFPTFQISSPWFTCA